MGKLKKKKNGTHMITYRVHVEFIKSAYATDTNEKWMLPSVAHSHESFLQYNLFSYEKPWCCYRTDALSSIFNIEKQSRSESNVVSGFIFYDIKKNLFHATCYVNAIPYV